jgi:hypothetical protein
MRIIVALLMPLFLVGCFATTVPVRAKFPEVPTALKEKCPPLNLINDGATLSEVSKTVTENYTKYYECSIKNDMWNEWYKNQKTIFEGVK